ncbi:hypothetical protein [Nocardioides aquiterrae]|uniref:Minor tail protein n=1 Tax=Nocardioides aquiterrae TaxID=203799 RepID=A0ABN1UBX3_9ACTN
MISGGYRVRLGSFWFDDASGFDDVEIRVYGIQRGRPVPITQVVDSMLLDGAIERRVAAGNRDQSLIIGLKGDPVRLAEVIEQLHIEAQKDVNEFACVPVDGDEDSTGVFDIVLADLYFDESGDWDLDELDGYQTWVLAMRAQPWVRAEKPTTVPALASGVTPASTTISDGTSAANWTGTSAVTASGGTLRQTVTASVYASDSSGTTYQMVAEFIYTPGSPLTSFATQNYLQVDAIPPAGGYSSGGNVIAFADGVELDMLTLSTIPGGGTRYFFECTDSSVATLKVRFEWVVTVAAGGTVPTWLFQIDNVESTNQAPSTADTPGREALRTVQVKGSARTPASLAIEHPTNGLGKVLLLSHPALGGGYAPNLRARRVSGSTSETPNANRVSGKESSVGTATAEVFRVPTRGLPRGGYLLLALPTGPSFTDVQTTVSTRLSTGALIGTKTKRNRNVRTEAGFDILADLAIPPADVPDASDATVEISVLSMSGSSVAYDEMFLCPLGDDGALTLVDCGATTAAALGTANSRLWIESASLERTAPTIWLGTAAGKADAYHAGQAAGSWMPHQLVPPSVTVFMANTGGSNPEVSGRYHRRGINAVVKESA